MTRVYVAGPMSGYPDHNFHEFRREAQRLRQIGFEVVNPVDINPDPKTPWAECMKVDIKALMDCDLIALLPNWEASRGARLEVHIAQALGIPTVPANIMNRKTA